MRSSARIGTAHRDAKAFDDKQSMLIKTFADQAVIAIENTRLFEAEQQRTRELSDSLEQQTATSEVLQVIHSSPGDLEPVFATMLENAVRICDAKFGNIYRWDGEALHLLPSHNVAACFRRSSQAVHRFVPMPETPRSHDGDQSGRSRRRFGAEATLLTRDPGTVAAVELGGVRTLFGYPDAERERTDRFVHRLPPRSSSLHRQADRAGHRTSPPKPSSPSRMRGC